MNITLLSKLYNEWNSLKKKNSTFGTFIINKTDYNFMEYTRFVNRCENDILLFKFLIVYFEGEKNE